MRKRIFPRIIWFLLLNCAIFILLAAMQFTRNGNFSYRIGDMLVNGRYSMEADETLSLRPLNGGASVIFGGLEFRLAAEYINVTENGATFILPDNTELSFAMPDTPELRITAKFPGDVAAGSSAAGGSAAVEIPFRTQRSSIVHDNGSDTVLYRGSRYQFSRPVQGFESGYLVLAASTPAVSYRAIADKREFIPANFIVPNAETAQDFSGVLSRWVTQNFALWGQMGNQTDEDTVIAWCGEAIRHGSYRTASAVVPVSFSTDPQRTWESAVYQFDRRIGVWERAARTISVFEREKNNRLSRLLAQKDSGILIEKHLVEFLAIRGYNDLIDNLLSFVQDLDPSVITLAMVPGILENSLDMDRWRPNVDNPFAPLVEQALQLAAHEMHRDGDHVFVFSNARTDSEFNLRLGMAVQKWGEKTGNNEWAAVGRSLALSVISLSGDNGSAPAFLTRGETGNAAGERISSARLYRILNDNDHLPHAAATGVNGIWAWTAATEVNISRTDTLMDISITRFPVGETHYVMLYNVPPFPLLQIYEVNWRRAVDFESYYNSSGWYYFEQDRILVIKINQRSNTENVRIYFTVPRAPEPEPPQVQPEPENQVELYQ
jgi:hypothetical protein